MWPIFIGFGILAIGRMTWWSVPDLAANATTGMRTPTVQYGATRSLTLSCLIMLVGLSLIGWGLWARYGLAWVAPGVAAHSIFLGGVLRLLRRTYGGDAFPSSVHARKAMSLVAIGEVMLAVLPLVAS